MSYSGQNGAGGQTTRDYFVPSCREERTYQPCQYQTRERINIASIKNQILPHQSISSAHTDFVNNYPQFDIANSGSPSNKLINFTQENRHKESAAMNLENSSTYLRTTNCANNSTYEGRVQPQCASKDYSVVSQVKVGGRDSASLRRPDCVWSLDPRNTIQRGTNDVKINNFSNGGVSLSTSFAPHSKRTRTVFEPHQVQRLQYEFQREIYMVGMKRKKLSKELNLTEKQIKIWFQNKRMKQKREYNRKLRHNLTEVASSRTT